MLRTDADEMGSGAAVAVCRVKIATEKSTTIVKWRVVCPPHTHSRTYTHSLRFIRLTQMWFMGNMLRII